ncbi:hypothetical protein EUX98_g9651 [Antrodiella citrinella]|uniref:Ubiquitin-like protease family profile domain-containing protein n=1 Tax=Antrodiella citrinella TaxID=2447956 RepID=A0A4S4LPE1_9APHY|nr:hypothetical protein EUX98_g9651 [Antrodiella citrinella]
MSDPLVSAHDTHTVDNMTGGHESHNNDSDGGIQPAANGDPVESVDNCLKIPANIIILLQFPVVVPQSASLSPLPSLVPRVSDAVSCQLPPFSNNIAAPNPKLYYSKSASRNIDWAHFNSIPVPSVAFIRSLQNVCGEQWKADYRSILWHNQTFPLYVLTLWEKLHDLKVWRGVVSWVKHVRDSAVVAKAVDAMFRDRVDLVVDAILDFRLDTVVTINGIATSCMELTTWCSHEWLSDIHVDQMLAILIYDILSHLPISRHKILPMSNTNKIVQLYHLRHAPNAQYPSDAKPTRFIHDVGTSLQCGRLRSIGGIFHVNNNHWVALVADVEEKIIYYGDSLDYSTSSAYDYVAGKVHAQAVAWWLGVHGIDGMLFDRLPISLQDDGYSCGLMSLNALAHHYLPKRHPLIHTSYVDVSRMDVLYRIIMLSCQTDSECITSPNPTQQPIRPSTPKPIRPSTPKPVQPADSSLEELQKEFPARLSVSPVKPSHKRAGSPSIADQSRASKVTVGSHGSESIAPTAKGGLNGYFKPVASFKSTSQPRRALKLSEVGSNKAPLRDVKLPKEGAFVSDHSSLLLIDRLTHGHVSLQNSQIVPTTTTTTT